MQRDRENQNISYVPHVSVVMGMYNCAMTLGMAIESIISQTYTDWELIVCDDASTDDTYRIANEYAARDSRIKVLRNEHNVGCNIVLNRCIEMARGEYIAVMDSDDISLPQRLEKEVAILDNNPQYVVVGTATIHFDEKGDFLNLPWKERPQPSDFVHGIPHAHPSCMVRRSAMLEIGCYHTEPGMRRVEDYYMFASLYARGYRGYNLQETLVRYCDDNQAYMRRTWQTRLNEVYTYSKAFKILRLPFILYPMLLRPIVVGLLPRPLYNYLHRRPWMR